MLETWIHTYPQDFAAPGAAGALNALVKSIVGKTYLLHYGSDFVPFLEHLSNVVDSDSAWAHKADHLLDDADDPYIISDSEEDSLAMITDSTSSNLSSSVPFHENSTGSNSRERKQSLPLKAKALILPIASSHPPEVGEIHPKQLLKELYRQSLELQNYDCSEIAEEITRVEAKLFLEIEVCSYMSNALSLTHFSYSQDTGSDLRSFLAVKILNLTLSHALILFQTILQTGKYKRHTSCPHVTISVGSSLSSCAMTSPKTEQGKLRNSLILLINFVL